MYIKRKNKPCYNPDKYKIRICVCTTLKFQIKFSEKFWAPPLHMPIQKVWGMIGALVISESSDGDYGGEHGLRMIHKATSLMHV